MAKTITDAQVTGSRGERFVGDLVEAMGYLWHPKGQLEGGLDGWIELRDPASGQLASEVVLVQSKSVDEKFPQEKADSFSFTVEPADLDYWLAFPLPVILIVSRKKTDDAYWVSVKDYFADPKRRASLKVRFDKKRDGFRGKGPQLRELARREAERRALPANAVLLGPVAPLGLSQELAEAEDAVADARKEPANASLWREAAKRWRALANAMTERGAARRLVWPALEEQAIALREAGDNGAAATAFIDLARDKIELDEPSARFDLGRIGWLLPPEKQGFEFDLLSSRANWFEQ